MSLLLLWNGTSVAVPTVTVVPGPGIRRRRKRVPAMTSAVHQLAEDLQVRDRWDAEDADLIDLVLTGVL